ncbi:MAG: AMP-binding protein [Acidimicrobiales bacterium]
MASENSVSRHDEPRDAEGVGLDGLTFAGLWEIVAEERPDARAQVQGDRVFTWRQFDDRADGLAAAMLAAGVAQQDKVAQYLYNCPEYLEGVFASFKAGLVPVNTNYRYADAELRYLWDNSDAAVVMFHGTFVPTIERIRDDCTKVKLWLHVDDGSHPCPAWATPWETATATPNDGKVQGPWGRHGSDLWLLYTGGTTGMPKGVMWAQQSLIDLVTRTAAVRLADTGDVPAWRENVASGDGAGVLLPAAPLMHGTGQIGSMRALTDGGCIVTMIDRSFDAARALDVVEREGVTSLAIVGDAFARPILAALDAEPDRWDLSKVARMGSSGVMWSQPVKQRLLEHIPQLMIADSLASSEALGIGASVTTKDSVAETAKFSLGPSAVVIADDGSLVEPGSGNVGRLGIRGVMPEGYYKDEVKTATTFPVIDGVRYSVPGDYGIVEADGSITLLGRGSVCINTGGEKVFPEEVEEVLKQHPGVVDAIAVGVPDERFGQIIAAVVEPTATNTADGEALIDHVRTHLARYKAPRHVLFTESLTRAPNGKIDYKKWTGFARDQLGVAAPS